MRSFQGEGLEQLIRNQWAIAMERLNKQGLESKLLGSKPVL